MQGINVPNLVHDDKIIATVTYTVGGAVIKQEVYTWTLVIPTADLIDVTYSPGDGSPAFQSERFDYTLTLPPGTSVTDTVLTKEPGDLHAAIVHRSAASDNRDLQICDDCDFDRVSARKMDGTCTWFPDRILRLRVS